MVRSASVLCLCWIGLGLVLYSHCIRVVVVVQWCRFRVALVLLQSCVILSSFSVLYSKGIRIVFVSFACCVRCVGVLYSFGKLSSSRVVSLLYRHCISL